MRCTVANRLIGQATSLLLVATALLSAPFTAAAVASDTYSFSATDVNTGDTLDLATLVEDRPLVVLVWSPHCPHCQRHMPYFAGLYSKLDLDTVNVVSIAVDCDRDEARDYATSKKLAFPVLLAKGGKVSDNFYKQGWPTTFVFAMGGKCAGFVDSTGPPYINDVMSMVDKTER